VNSTGSDETIKSLKLNRLAVRVLGGLRKKGDSILKVRLQKLLKTHIEKMSLFGSEQKLLKNKLVKNFLKVCY
jgi:hypothetical protein